MYDIQKGKQHVKIIKKQLNCNCLLFFKRLHIDLIMLICPKTMQQYTSTVNFV